MNTPPTFADLGLSAPVLEALSRKGFEEPTPIQALVIPELLAAECDLIGQAQTGTGKTAAFALPLIEKLIPGAGGVQALVLAPTRELAVQVCEEISSLKGTKPFSVAPVYGGQAYTEQLRRFKMGVDILVGTPGRILDHLERGSLKLDKLQYLILDEADEMLDMGFSDDIETLLEQVNPDRKMLLFSATMPDRIRVIANKHMKNPKTLTVKTTTLTTERTEQIYFEVNESDKFESLCRILDLEEDFYGMVFCRTKIQTDELSHRLADRGYGSEALHGDLTQGQREQVLNKFKKKRINVLCATDVAARGIDVDGLTHVINFSLPQDPEAYVHRIGRTGRAGREGLAVTLVGPRERTLVRRIEDYPGQGPARWFAPADLVPHPEGLPVPPRAMLKLLDGKKDKIRPGDVLGALTAAAGFAKDQIGAIKVTEWGTWIAVDRAIVEAVYGALGRTPVKGRLRRVFRIGA